jgi:peptidoglycan/xylan/chitin deacetylase (PgdA/CDA1 family)
MDMDIYKLSLISIGVSIFIVASGIFLGLRNGDSDKNNIYLTGIPFQGGEENLDDASTGILVENQNLVVGEKTVSVKDQELRIELSFDQNRLYFPIQRNPNMEYSVFLTFNEDQLSENQMVDLLRDLKISGVRATFFVRGQSLIQNPKLWSLVVSEGHQVSNYTYSKTSMANTNGLELVEEIKRWEIAANTVLGTEYVDDMKKNFPYFRFPSEKMVTEEVFLRMVNQAGYRAVGWQYSLEDLLMGQEYETAKEKAVAMHTNLSKVAGGGPILSLKLNDVNAMYIREMISSLSNNDIRVRNMLEGFRVSV